jgi:hypothetical protein
MSLSRFEVDCSLPLCCCSNPIHTRIAAMTRNGHKGHAMTENVSSFLTKKYNYGQIR